MKGHGFAESLAGGIDAASFAVGHEDALALKLSVLAPPSSPIEVKTLIEQLARKRSQQEVKIIEQACREFAALTAIAQKEFEIRINEALEAHPSKSGALIGRTKSFLSTSSAVHLPNQVNVRVVAADAKWPSVSDITQDMQRRQDRKDDTVRELVLDMEMSLLKAENDMMEKVFHGESGRFPWLRSANFHG